MKEKITNLRLVTENLEIYPFIERVGFIFYGTFNLMENVFEFNPNVDHFRFSLLRTETQAHSVWFKN